jgi:hypothetical protein
VTRLQFVADHQQRYGVKRLCQLVGVARSSFYYWRATAADRAARDAADAVLAVRIRAVRAAHDGTYGAPRVTMALRPKSILLHIHVNDKSGYACARIERMPDAMAGSVNARTANLMIPALTKGARSPN